MQCIRSSYCIDNFFYYIPFPPKKIHFKRNYVGTFDDVSCGMFSNFIISNIISLVLSDSDTESENVNLIRCSVSDGQKTCSSKVVSLIGT